MNLNFSEVPMQNNRFPLTLPVVLALLLITVSSGCNTQMPIWLTHGAKYKKALAILETHSTEIDSIFADERKQSQLHQKTIDAIYDRFSPPSFDDPNAILCDDLVLRSPAEVRAWAELERIQNEMTKTIQERIRLLKAEYQRKCSGQGISRKTAAKAWSDFIVRGARANGTGIKKETLKDWCKNLKSSWCDKS